jgi:hypothetical protein
MGFGLGVKEKTLKKNLYSIAELKGKKITH